MAGQNSTLGALVPLVITVVLLLVVAVVGYIAYQIAMDVADKTNKKMEKKNMSLHKDGLKVGVKEVSAEQVGDSTQSVLVKAWNASGLDSKSAKGQSNKTTPQSSTSSASRPSTQQRSMYSQVTM